MQGNRYMNMRLILATIAIANLFIRNCDGYGRGAPASVCTGLVPIHREITAQVSASPYQLIASNTSIITGGSVSVRVSTREPFAGFFIVGINPANSAKIGTFSNPPASNPLYQRGPCRIADSTNTSIEFASITHVDSSNKTALEVIWTAPAEFVGTVCFNGTVAQARTAWWGVLAGDCVQVGTGSTVKPDNSTTISTVAGNTTPRSPSGPPVTVVTVANKNGSSCAATSVTLMITLVISSLFKSSM